MLTVTVTDTGDETETCTAPVLCMHEAVSTADVSMSDPMFGLVKTSLRIKITRVTPKVVK